MMNIWMLMQGLIWTAGIMFKVLHALNIPLNVQEVRHVL